MFSSQSAPQNCFPLKSATLSMFHSQMVRLKIVFHSNHPLYRCFSHKWYAPKLFPTQIGHFIHVSLANGMPQNYFPLNSATSSMFPSQMVRLKIASHSIRPLNPCFPRKRYASKLCSTQIGHFIHVSFANGMPQNCFPLKSAILSMFPLSTLSHTILMG